MDVRARVAASSLGMSLVALLSCGHGSETSGEGGGFGEGSVGFATAVTISTGATGFASCPGAATGYQPACAACLETHCCDALAVAMGANAPELVACAQASCSACDNPTPPPFDLQCVVPTTPGSAGSCIALGSVIACNPVTNEGCDPGQACDRDAQNGGFSCFSIGNTEDLCADCGEGFGYCKKGLACVGQCGRYCCSDDDCAPGSCVKVTETGTPIFTQSSALGVCAAPESPPGSTTSSSVTGSGVGGAGGAPDGSSGNGGAGGGGGGGA